MDPALYATIFRYFSLFIRFILPVLGVLILLRCVRSMLRRKDSPEVWAYLTLPNGGRVPLTHWENTIGRSPASDVVLNYPTISRSHAAVVRGEKGDWTLIDLDSKGGVTKNGKAVEGSAPVSPGDVLNLGGVQMVIADLSPQERREQAQARPVPGREIHPAATFFLLTVFCLLLGLQHCIAAGDALVPMIPIAFGALIAIMWLYYGVISALRRTGFEVECIAFFLTAIGLSVICSYNPGELKKQLLCILLGILVFLALGWCLRNLERVKKLRWPAAIGAVALLAATALLAESIYGAKNWIFISGFSIQPSEFVKLLFVFAGGATLDRLFAKRNIILFIGLAGACVGALALMGDFGTAIIFFAGYLVIAFLRSGDLKTLVLSIAAAGFAGFLALTVKPYIADRFATWGRAWQFVNESGYQQTRTMSAAAGGGLFGLGAGEGWLSGIVAADTDLVFGIVQEELGLILGLLCILCIVALALFTFKAAGDGRSSYYVIVACAAAAMLVFQTSLNVLGALDILPLTGVTFPFVSNGGSSMISCWGMLAFIKANDTRKNASFIVRLPKGSAAEARAERERIRRAAWEEGEYEES